MRDHGIHPVPPPSPPAEEAKVTVHALSAGHLTLPERFFVHPSDGTARRTVPSLAFLVQHEDLVSLKKTRLLFDLGLRRDVRRYSYPIQRHIETRQPLSTHPDVVRSLAKGGLTPNDIDYVIYSHVHWDHIGEPRDFDRATFVVGNGARNLLTNPPTPLRGSHSNFEADLLPYGRSIELPSPSRVIEDLGVSRPHSGPVFHQPWQSHGPNLPRVLDIFQDGSVLIVDAPGHLPGHINLLLRVSGSRDRPSKKVYLAGDACHDRRIVRGQRDIGEWKDDSGHICCIHADKKEAEATINRIRSLEREGTEIIFAHDVEWEESPQNASRFFGVT